MTDTRAAFNRGTVAGALLILGALAFYWFLSGSSADATAVRRIAVSAQALLGFGGAAILWLNQRRSERREGGAA